MFAVTKIVKLYLANALLLLIFI